MLAVVSVDFLIFTFLNFRQSTFWDFYNSASGIIKKRATNVITAKNKLMQAKLNAKSLFRQEKQSFQWCLLLALVFIFFTDSFAQPAQIIEWEKFYKGVGEDKITCWVETSDGYIIGGNSDSNAGGPKTENSKGASDYWIIKINKDGNKVWDKTIGGSGGETLRKIIKVADGFLLCGSSASPQSGDKSQPSKGETDFWVVKVNNNGQKIWDRTIGGSANDVLRDAVITPDNQLLLGGDSSSPVSGDKSAPAKSISSSSSDYWIVKINLAGSKIWDKAYGGLSTNPYNGSEILTSLLSVPDGGFILFGSSGSEVGLDKTSEGVFWIVKVNSAGDKVWDRSYRNDILYAGIVGTPDGGFIMTGTIMRVIYESSYYSEIIMNKVDASGNTTWTKTFNSLGENYFQVISGVAPISNGFSLLYGPQYGAELYMAKLNYNGDIVSYCKIYDRVIMPTFLQYSSAGEAFIGYAETNKSEYNLLKYKAAQSSPAISLELVQPYPNSGPGPKISVYPSNISSPVSRVEFYIDGSKVFEDNSLPYDYYWNTPNRPLGDRQVQAKAYLANGQMLASAVIPFRVFEYSGIQAEPVGYVPNDVGSFSVREEKAITLNGGSSVRLWDIGDRARYYVPSNYGGKTLLKVRVRSGMYSLTSTYSNPTAYWPNGYIFTMNGTPVTFKGDPGSISDKNPAYGGSYWGTMSAEVNLNATNSNILEIQAAKEWAGIDYLEFISLSPTKIEAELAYTIFNDIGTRQIGEEQYNTLSAGSSVKLWDVGDEAGINVYSSGGPVVINARVRAGVFSGSYDKPTIYWPGGYSFRIDNNPITMTGDNSTLSGKDLAYGGSYWGTMKSAVMNLSPGLYVLYVKSNREWAGIDYVELVPVQPSSSARIAEQVEEGSKEGVYPNPFNNNLTIHFSEKLSETCEVTVADAYGKVYLKELKDLKEENSLEIDGGELLPQGVLVLRVKLKRGEHTYRVIKY
jgi:hypothetical protein